MKYVLLPFQILWRVLFSINFLVTLVLVYPFFAVLLAKESWFPAAFRLKQIWATMLTVPLGIFWKVEGKANVDKHIAYVICPNHTSYLDIIVMYTTLSKYFHFMGKKELGDVPLFNIFFKRMNILVDRESKIGAVKALQRAAEDLRKGVSIIMFPEGTIPKNTPKLKKFKNGPFKLAIDEQVSILPVTFVNNWNLLPDTSGKKLFGRPGLSRVIIHEPVPTQGMAEGDLEELKTIVYNSIHKPLIKYGSR